MDSRKVILGAAGIAVTMPTTAHAWSWGWGTKKSYKKKYYKKKYTKIVKKHGKKHHKVPEIDAMSGVAALAVVIAATLLIREKFFRA